MTFDQWQTEAYEYAAKHKATLRTGQALSNHLTTITPAKCKVKKWIWVYQCQNGKHCFTKLLSEDQAKDSFRIAKHVKLPWTEIEE